MRFLPRLSYANVMATIGVFLALGGISYAATNLSKNSVGTKQIKKNAVTAKKIKKNAVTASKIKKNAVATAKIKNKAVTQGKVDPNLLSKIDEDAKLMVFNGDGSVLGTFAGTYPQAPIAILQVLIDGGLYSYYGSGQLIPFATESVSYKNASCSGTPYVELDSQGFDFIFSKLAGGPSRVVYRPFTGPTNLGPISAWQFTTRSEDVTGQNLWELHSDGTCDPTSSSPYTGLLGELESVSPPPDGIGPLTVG